MTGIGDVYDFCVVMDGLSVVVGSQGVTSTGCGFCAGEETESREFGVVVGGQAGLMNDCSHTRLATSGRLITHEELSQGFFDVKA